MTQFGQVRKAFQTNWKRTSSTISFIILSTLLLIAVGITLLQFDSFGHLPSTAAHGGNCAAIGRRQPSWVDDNKMRSRISEFVKIYNGRPFRDNKGGMRFDHSFALWYMLQAIQPQPSAVIESGALRGHSTWIIRKALPHVRIISISPEVPLIKLRKTVYITGPKFIDFNGLSWKRLKIDTKTALVFLDDHQSVYRRIFKEGLSRGFRRFILDDNYEYRQGDELSMKWLCEVHRKSEWQGKVPDDFGRKSTPQTWSQHISVAKSLDSSIKYYYEFPPAAVTNLTRQKRYKEELATPALISDNPTFSKLLGSVPLEEFGFYTHMCYVEIND